MQGQEATAMAVVKSLPPQVHEKLQNANEIPSWKTKNANITREVAPS